MKKRIFVLALDGVPYRFLKKAFAENLMPAFRSLSKKGQLRQMDSVFPPVSSAAWASFLTGKQPPEHGINGFVDRDANTMEWFIPNAKHLKVKTIAEELSQMGKRVFMMNVPATFPPKQINGISICGFLGTDIVQGTWPPMLGSFLKARGYVIDANTELAKKDLPKYLVHLDKVLNKRIETMWYFYEREKWDFFMAHIMETDRINHFLWQFWEDEDIVFAPQFRKFYQKIDQLILNVQHKISSNDELILLSDHGFTTLYKEVYLNKWLADQGYLSYSTPYASKLSDMAGESLAYSLYPGRIFVNLKGREKNGKVNGGEYFELRNEIAAKALQLSDTETGNKIIKKVIYGEAIYPELKDKLNFPHSNIPDLLFIPNNGYELKSLFGENQSLFAKTAFNGMHTFDDAFLFSKQKIFPNQRLAIHNLKEYIVNSA
jgi:predicted AlkP superfamily phosphohydrolase/phosphomutase